MSEDTNNKPCNIKSVKFVRGITGEDEILEEPKPNIVVAGRSNSGKSSVINTVVNEKVARVSKKPGKTQEINFFDIDRKAYLVDLPGYGYAKMSAKEAERMRKQMIWYLARSGAPIQLLVLVLDIRRGLQDIDRELLDIASGEGISVVVVANKVDKCNQSERTLGRREISEEVKSHPQTVVGLVEFSATKGTGRDALCDIITSCYAD